MAHQNLQTYLKKLLLLFLLIDIFINSIGWRQNGKKSNQFKG